MSTNEYSRKLIGCVYENDEQFRWKFIGKSLSLQDHLAPYAGDVVLDDDDDEDCGGNADGDITRLQQHQ